MKPIIFCNIAYMKYYKGIIDGVDEPVNGGAYVQETNDAHEAYNFDFFRGEGDETDFCIGFVMLAQSLKNKTSQLHIEKINGCQLSKNEESVDGVTVVWCAKSDKIDGMRVVGWYKDATVYRYPQFVDFINGYVQEFNFIDKKENCVLLPENERFSSKWIVLRSGHNGYDFGFGRSNLWYAQGTESNAELKSYIENLSEQIENYNGENWIDKEVK